MLEIEELIETKKFRIKNYEKKIRSLPKENPFDFTDYLERQREEINIDFGLF